MYIYDILNYSNKELFSIKYILHVLLMKSQQKHKRSQLILIDAPSTKSKRDNQTNKKFKYKLWENYRCH